MQQFVLEAHLDIMCCESGEEMEDFMVLARDEFVSLCCACMQRILVVNGDY